MKSLFAQNQIDLIRLRTEIFEQLVVEIVHLCRVGRKYIYI